MVGVVKLIGILAIVIGVVYALNPKTLKRVLAFFGEGKGPYVLAGIRFVAGVILLLAASQCKVAWFVAVMGILALIGGITVPVIGSEKCKDMIKRWQEKPDKTLRLVSIIPIIIGLLLLNAA